MKAEGKSLDEQMIAINFSKELSTDDVEVETVVPSKRARETEEQRPPPTTTTNWFSLTSSSK